MIYDLTRSLFWFIIISDIKQIKTRRTLERSEEFQFKVNSYCEHWKWRLALHTLDH